MKTRATLAAVAPLLVTTACQISPYSEQNFTAIDQAIPFEGCSLQPKSPITINAGSQTQSYVWDVIATTTSAATVSYTDSLKTNWYCWQKNVQISETYWWYSPPTSRYATAVKVLDNGAALYTYKNDPSTCTQPWGASQLTGSAPCAVAPDNSGNADGSSTFFAGSMIITATASSIY